VIHWGDPRMLWLLVLVPLIGALLLVGARLRRSTLTRLADAALVPRLTDSRSPRWAGFKVACVLAGLVLVLIAAARPRWGEKLQVVSGRGIDVVIALDASRSMLATDVAPSRLARAKVQVASLLDNLASNRVGIVAFAGDAQVMCPLTPDVEAAKQFLDIIDPDNMPRPGTNIPRAVEVSASLFDAFEESSKAVVLITDGDNLDGDPTAAMRLAGENHVRLFAVGVGTPSGSTVPESQAPGTSYKKDEKGNVVVSRLGEPMLLVMTKATGGRYFRSESINLDALVGALDQIQKKSIAGGDYVEYEERYQGFLLAGFVLLLAGLFVSDRRGGWFPGLAWPSWLRWRLRGAAGQGGAVARGTGAALALAAMLGISARAQADVGSTMRRGLALERKGKYDDAVKVFRDALVLEPDNERIHYDLGRALDEAHQEPEAAQHFQLGALTKNRGLRSRTLYNLGNTKFRQNQLDEAIAAYQLALLQDPRDVDAKQNLEYCLKKKQEKPPQPDSTQKPNPQQRPQPQPQSRPPQQAQAQPQKGAIGKEQADRMLQALQARQKENMKNQPKPQPQAAPGGRDW
jgi:Ca-activated chloride channel family protein